MDWLMRSLERRREGRLARETESSLVPGDVREHPYPHTKVGIDTEHFQALEHFTLILYDKTSSLHYIDEARKEQFCQKGKIMERLPPTQDALLQHTKRGLVFGALVNIVSNVHLLQKVEAGLLMRRTNHGFLFGTPYPWLPRLVVSL